MYLHLYAQYSHHDDAQIMGDRESLIALRDAIDEAIKQDYTIAIPVFTNDGECYALHVTCLDSLDRLALPYTADYLCSSLDPSRDAAIYRALKVLQGCGRIMVPDDS